MTRFKFENMCKFFFQFIQQISIKNIIYCQPILGTGDVFLKKLKLLSF